MLVQIGALSEHDACVDMLFWYTSLENDQGGSNKKYPLKITQPLADEELIDKATT